MATLQPPKTFEERLTQWVSTQGLLFQLRHAPGKSVAARLGARLVRIGVTAAALIGLAAVSLGYYLVKRVDSPRVRSGLNGSAAAALGADSAQVIGFARSRDRAYVRVLKAEGGKGTFFHRLEARGVRYRMGLFDGLVGQWNAGPLTVTSARIWLKGGAEEPTEATQAKRSLFGTEGRFQFDLVEVMEASMEWGYSERTQGSIARTHLIAQRVDDGWRLRCRGGRFRQNWLKRIEIEELLLLVTPDGVTIEKGDLRSGSGHLTMQGKVSSGLRPEYAARLSIKHMALAAMLPPETDAFIDGTISGELRITGSTNTQNGLVFEGEMSLAEGDGVVLRQRLPVLGALTVVDPYNRFRKVKFTTGTFRMHTGGGELMVDNLEFDAPDVMTLRGRLQVRPPNEEEVRQTLAEGPRESDSALLKELAGDRENEGDTVEDFSLRRAAEEERKALADKDPTHPFESPVAAPGSLGPTAAVSDSLRNRYANMPRYEGVFLMLIPGNAFDKARGLREMHPVDPQSGRIPLEVPVHGSLFDITVEQAAEIYAKGTRGD